MMTNTSRKAQLHSLFNRLAGLPPAAAIAALGEVCLPDARFYVGHPVNECVGVEAFVERFLAPMQRALRPLMRRDDIFMSGTSRTGSGDWVAAMGHYVGNFQHKLFNIQPHDRLAFVRYGEFYRLDGDRIAEARLLVEFVDLARQAGQMKLPPAFGTDMLFPAPASHDGVMLGANNPTLGEVSAALVEAMLGNLRHYTPGSFDSVGQTGTGGYWHEAMLWYGPAGIGSNYTYDGFQKDHRIPFLTGFPDRVGGNHFARFGDGNYVCSGGWPSINATHGGTYLGVPATNRKITQRVMDFWRCADGKIMENWVFIDLPDLFLQIGHDVLP